MDVFSDTTGKKYLYRYRTANHFTIDEILNHYLFMTARSQLNDLNEFKWKLETSGSGNVFDATTEEKKAWIIGGIKNHGNESSQSHIEYFQLACSDALRRGKGQYEKFINAEVMELVSNILRELAKHTEDDDALRIACFSKKPLNATMMGHYGGNEGVIIAYDVQEIEKQLGQKALTPVVYGEKPFIYPLSRLSDSKTADLIDSIHIGMCATKLDDWSYEQEVRLVLQNRYGINDSHQMVLFPSVVAGVCLAPRVSKPFANVLIYNCGQRKIPVYQAAEKEGTYQFNVNRLNAEKYNPF